MFDRFTEAARRVLFFARCEAGRAGATAIEPDLLLFGLLRDVDTIGRRVLDGHRSDPEALHHQIEARASGGSARTMVEITRLALPQQLIEVSFTAVVPDQPTIRLSSRT